VKLEEYQKPHVKRLIEVLKTKRGALDLSHTGTGKTVTGCAVVQKLDRPLAVVAPLAALPGWERTAKAFDLDFKAVNYESVTKKRGFVSASRIDIPKNAIVIYDEGHKCLTGSSLIQTEVGLIPIEELVMERLDVKVASYNFSSHEIEYKRIKARFYKTSPIEFYGIKAGQTKVFCTAEHKIWTDSGWKTAKEILERNLQGVRDCVLLYAPWKKALFEEVFRRLEIQATRFVGSAPGAMQEQPRERETLAKSRYESRQQEKDDRKKPYALGKKPPQSLSDVTEDWPRTESSGRKWKAVTVITQAVLAYNFIRQTFQRGISNLYCRAQNTKSPDVLQTGFCNPGVTPGNRDRWWFAQLPQTSGSGPEENSNTRWTRVDSCAIYERADTEGTGEGKERNQYVFDIEVEDNHNYFANDILVHNCKNYKTQNAKTMLRVSRAGFKILTLSATLADHAEQLRAWNDAFRFSDAYSFSEFMYRCGYYYEKNRWGGSWLPRYENAIERTKRVIAPFSSIMTRPPGFKNQINVTVISSKEDKALAKLYEDTFKLLRSGDKKRDGDHLTRMLRARQASERAKIDYVIEKIVDLMAEGFSVPVFCNFNNTIDELAARLSGFNPAIIRGGQKPGERESERVRFQENKARVILCNIASGGVALDLHDVNGRPRYSLFFPPLSGVELKQGLGRIDRRGSLSDSTQEIIFSDVPAEVRVYEILKEKLSALDTLHDSEIDILGGVNV